MNERDLRKELLAAETISPALKSRYEEEIRRMLEKRLTPVGKIAWAGSSVLGLAFLVVFGYTAWSLPAEFPVVGRVAFIVSALFGLAWAIFALSVVRKGQLHLRRDPAIQGVLTWLFLVLLSVAMLLMSGRFEDPARGALMIAQLLVFLVLFGLPLAWEKTKATELNLREQMLKLELKLAELSDRIEKR